MEEKKFILNILGAEVEVIEMDDLEDRQDCRGRAAFKENEIWIDSSLEGFEYWQVLFHEVSHWILYRNGLAEKMDPVIQEAICDTNGFVLSENYSIFSEEVESNPPDKQNHTDHTSPASEMPISDIPGDGGAGPTHSKDKSGSAKCLESPQYPEGHCPQNYRLSSDP